MLNNKITPKYKKEIIFLFKFNYEIYVSEIVAIHFCAVGTVHEFWMWETTESPDLYRKLQWS